MKDKDATVTMSLASLKYFESECLAVHGFCDLADVPRTNEEGETYSMAQRVEILQEVSRAVMRSIGMDPHRIH